MKPTIALFGSSLARAFWNGAATYYRGMLRAMAQRGYEITFYEPDAYERLSHCDIADPPWARVVVYSVDEPGVCGALDEAKSADVIIKASGVGVYDDWLEAAIVEEKSRHTSGGDDVAAVVSGLDRGLATRIGEAALRRVVAHHTYDQRAAHLDGLLVGQAVSR